MSPRSASWLGVAVGTLLLAGGCVTLRPAPVGPGDIPALQEAVAREPGSGEAHLRLSAALAAAGRCDEAVGAAQRGRELSPGDPVGPLVIGGCREEAGDLEGALALYASFLAEHGDAPGAAAVEGRLELALRRQARASARAALAREETLEPGDPETVGVFPFLVAGDSAYQALSVGLAHMLTTDLALIRRFRIVERVQVEALLQEMEIPAERVDPTTAARAGRLLGASRMVLGTVSIPSGRELRMGGNIVLETGEQVEPLSAEGSLNDLLSLEKELAIQVAENLGYALSEADRQRILENRPGSLAAFLAFSRGLLEEDRGDFEAAAALYRDALQSDPEYGEARDRLQGAVGADVAAGTGPGEVTTVAYRVEEALQGPPADGLMAGALASSVLDIASHQPERATLGAGTSSTIMDTLLGDSAAGPSLEAILSILITIPR